MRVLFMSLFLVLFVTVNLHAQTNLAEQHFEKGTQFAKSRKHQKAIEHYKRALKIRGNSKKQKTKIRYNIGACFYQLEEFKKAEDAFSQAIKLSRDKHIQAIYSLGLTQIELEKLNSAAANFRKVIRLNGKHGEAWFDIGMILLEQKKYENAKLAFQKSIEFKTKRIAEAENNLGVIFTMKGKIEFAISQFEKAIFHSKGKLELAKENLKYWKRYKKLELTSILAIK